MTTLRECQREALACIQRRFKDNESETNISICTGGGKSRIICKTSHALPGAERVIIVFPSLMLLTQYVKDYKLVYTTRPLYYLATEGTLSDVPRLSEGHAELHTSEWCVLTTYASAPLIYEKLTPASLPRLIVHDEAHHITSPVYAAAMATVSATVHRINLSATLPIEQIPHYKYSLLRGIADGVVRNFNMDLFVCVDRERNETALLELIVRKLLTHHTTVKLLVYTREANTTGEKASSVNTFLVNHADKLRANNWWIEGIKEDTKDRDAVLRAFEGNGATVSILVSCRTLSEGIDLKGANCMLPWDPTASNVDNIQRIGRVLRLYKDRGADEQLPSTVVVPVFLPEAEYAACDGDLTAINALLEAHIAEGERGNFRPIVNVCTALKSELADEDAELFNTLLNYPHRPKVSVNRGLLECVAKACKKSVEDLTEEVADALEATEGNEDVAEAVREGEWDEEDAGEVVVALAKTQGITLVVRDGDETEMYGSGEQVVTVEKKGDEDYKVVKSGSKKPADAAKKRVAHRMRVIFSDECQVLLGLESVEGADAMGGMVLSRLTMEVRVDENWEARLAEWAVMYEKLGRCPPSMSKDPEEKRVGKWQTHQRRNYKKRASWMTPERIATLNATPGWIWKKEDTWGSMLQAWIQQTQKLGRLPTQISKDPDEKRAGKWQSAQRENYKNCAKWMTPERIVTLNATPGWKWEEDTWNPMLQAWIQQTQKLGRLPTQISKDPEEKRADNWQQTQRQNYKKNTLTSERIAILNATPGWKWEEDNSWEPALQHWIQQFEKLRKTPSKESKDPGEKRAGNWQSNQRQNYKKNILTAERIEILNATPGWKWDEDRWESALQHWIQQTQRLGRPPSSKSKDPDEKKTGRWQYTQRNDYKNNYTYMTPERIATLNATPGWTWSANKAPLSTRKRHITEPKPESTSETPIQRQRSALELYHKRFKTMNANTYTAAIAANPADFTKYHDVADTYDARDPPERQPLTKIAALLTRFNKPSYKAIDLGCGRNRLRTLPAISQMSWTSVDVCAADATVTIADMGALPYEDETYDIAVLGRSLWARNHEDVLRETQRILKVGGRAVICESFQRWFNTSDNQNTLIQCLSDVGFDIVYEEGTRSTDEVKDVFQYIVALKK
jgi:superfamily II DNA or RNA helicase/ubiquinone/menaquinone biosynthesis C-methylase UbiE